MLIVSQNENYILNMDSIEIINTDQNATEQTSRVIAYTLSTIENDEHYVLGTYSTEEKAKMCIGALISAYSNDEKVFFMPEE